MLYTHAITEIISIKLIDSVVMKPTGISTTKRRGCSYWTKRREILHNTETHMKEVKELLFQANEIADTMNINVVSNCKQHVLEPLITASSFNNTSCNKDDSTLLTNNESCSSTSSDINNDAYSMKNDRFESLFIPEMDIDDDHDDDASSTSSMGSYQSLGSDDGFVHSESNVNVVEQLSKWAVEFNISQVALKHLILILKPLISDLPNDPRTLLSTPRNYVVKDVGGGSYYYFGITKHLLSIIENGTLIPGSVIYLQINIDGVPLYKSSKKQLWPILGKIVGQNLPSFIIGIFCGESKPNDVKGYFSDFVEEMKSIEANGILTSQNKIVQVKITCFVCDAPARAFVKQTKSHNAYYGCERCTQRGVWHSKVTYPDCYATLRTDESFNARSDANHHGLTPSPLQELSIGLVSQFVLDPMHLVYLGVTKKLLWLWMKGPLSNKCRIGSVQIKSISDMLVRFYCYIPREFGRKCRSLHEVERWKATEYRQFLLYSGIVALHKHLPKAFYMHFLLLYVAIFFISSGIHYKTHSDYASKLLVEFVNEFHSFYGKDMVVYNVHCLIHLVMDVEKYGPLDTFSAFSFESFLGQLKKIIRKPNQPLPQIVRRVAENAKLALLTQTKVQKSEPKHKHNFGPLPLAYRSYSQFNSVHFDNQ